MEFSAYHPYYMKKGIPGLYCWYYTARFSHKKTYTSKGRNGTLTYG
jgi:hypothetical protein